MMDLAFGMAAALAVTVSLPLLAIARAIRDLSATVGRHTDAMLTSFEETDTDDGPDDDDGEPIPEPGSNVVAIGRVA